MNYEKKKSKKEMTKEEKIKKAEELLKDVEELELSKEELENVAGGCICINGEPDILNACNIISNISSDK